jgi:hypothetical protein
MAPVQVVTSCLFDLLEDGKADRVDRTLVLLPRT